MRFATVTDGDFKHYNSLKIVPTPQSYSEAMDLVSRVINDISEGDIIDGIVGGVPGVLDKNNRMLLKAPNLLNWEGMPLRESLIDITCVEPVLFNDADLSALGEATFGAGKGFSIVMYITASTGLGGGIVIDKEIVKHHFGFEPGFQIIDDDEFTTLHEYIAGSALKLSHHKDAKDIEDEFVWKCVFDKLTIGINNSIVHWSPDVVVLGGSIMERFDIEEIAQAVKSRLTIFPNAPEFKRAELKDVNGLYGGIAYLKKKTGR